MNCEDAASGSHTVMLLQERTIEQVFTVFYCGYVFEKTLILADVFEQHQIAVVAHSLVR